MQLSFAYWISFGFLLLAFSKELIVFGDDTVLIAGFLLTFYLIVKNSSPLVSVFLANHQSHLKKEFCTFTSSKIVSDKGKISISSQKMLFFQFLKNSFINFWKNLTFHRSKQLLLSTIYNNLTIINIFKTYINRIS